MRAARERRLSLDHLDPTLLQFDSDAKPHLIRPKCWRGDIEASSRHKMARSVLDVLRRANGERLTSREVASRFMADRGLDTGNTVLVRAMVRRIDKALRRQKTKDVIQSATDGPALVWRLRDAELDGPDIQ